MKGYYVPRRFGWDCHGLPIENEIEKAFNLTGATSIEAFGIANFNEECRKIVLRYTEEWKVIGAPHGTLGRFLPRPTTRWTFPLWSLSGGSSSSFMKKGLSMKALK